MRGYKRALKVGGLGVMGLVLLIVATIFGGSELILRKTYTAERRQISPADHQHAREGQRLATLVGCNGCHERNLQGSVFFDEPNVARIYATNLALTIPSYTDSQFEAAVRQGIRPNGRSVFGMPSAAFAAINDQDLTAILSYLRSVPARGDTHPAISIGVVGRVGLLIGRFKPEARNVRDASLKQPFVSAKHERGRYLARMVCSECHGLDLSGGEGTPDLNIAGAYNLDSFARLMRSGAGAGNRDLGLMSRVAKDRFSSFTDEEISQLHAYLVERAQSGSPK